MHQQSARPGPLRRTTVVIPVAVIAVVLTVVVDQITKSFAVGRLRHGSTDWPGPFRFRLVANRGALIGLPVPIWMMLVVTVIILVLAISAVTRSSSRSLGVGWALLLGGAMGNMIDRFRHRPGFPDHAVVDWIASSRLPTFNLADAAIVVGIVTLALSSDAEPTTRIQPSQSHADQSAQFDANR